jgi:hypothetical protein
MQDAVPINRKRIPPLSFFWKPKLFTFSLETEPYAFLWNNINRSSNRALFLRFWEI